MTPADTESVSHRRPNSTSGKSKVACFATTSATILQTVAYALPDWLIFVNQEGIRHYRVGLWQFCVGALCEEYTPLFWPVWFLVVEGLETIGLVCLLISALLLSAYALLPPRTPSRVRCTGILAAILTFSSAAAISCGIIVMVVKMFQEGFNDVLGPGSLTLDWSTKLSIGSAIMACAGAITLAVDLQVQADLQAFRCL